MQFDCYWISFVLSTVARDRILATVRVTQTTATITHSALSIQSTKTTAVVSTLQYCYRKAATVRVNKTFSAVFKTEASARQDCLQSNSYSEFILRKVLGNEYESEKKVY